jgi:Protein of unknown function (DUF3303)
VRAGDAVDVAAPNSLTVADFNRSDEVEPDRRCFINRMQKCVPDVVATVARPDVTALPLEPKNPLAVPAIRGRPLPSVPTSARGSKLGQRNRDKENEMKYVIAWTYRLNGSAAENDQSLRRGLVLFSKWTTPPSTTYHQFVGRADGGGGFAVIETDNPSDLTDATGKFGHLLDYQIYPVVDIDQSARSMEQGAEFRDSIK